MGYFYFIYFLAYFLAGYRMLEFYLVRHGFLLLSLNTLALLKSHLMVYLYRAFESLSYLDLFFSKALIRQSITVFLFTIKPEKDDTGSKVSLIF